MHTQLQHTTLSVTKKLSRKHGSKRTTRNDFVRGTAPPSVTHTRTCFPVEEIETVRNVMHLRDVVGWGEVVSEAWCGGVGGVRSLVRRSFQKIALPD